MKRTRKILVWAWIVLVLEVCSISLPEISDKKFIEDCVKEHNTARSAVSPPASNMLYMTQETILCFQATTGLQTGTQPQETPTTG
ncbi:glioma pathogenesis-related protein 1-like [Nothobranchius furzeri]|uniref:Glioma pathogenesis-related protein 1-like n=1 Tax=Nothobranchius furzeri TaxID=105023 RepID=A0A9D3C1I0_NOTFU|nr:glioma pathogenesis-related protein 1-like [Nothobranchius furzeri]